MMFSFDWPGRSFTPRAPSDAMVSTADVALFASRATRKKASESELAAPRTPCRLAKKQARMKTSLSLPRAHVVYCAIGSGSSSMTKKRW